MKIIELNVEQIREYEKNNRIHSQEQIERIAKSIKEFGFNQPLVVDENHVLLVGHGRLMASKHIGLVEVPVLVKDSLSEDEKRAYRILDNKIQADSEWNLENLEYEVQFLTQAGYELTAWGLDNFDFATLGNNSETSDTLNGDNQYTDKIELPIYEPTGEKPTQYELYDNVKTLELIEEINRAKGISYEEKQFLISAAYRHTVYRYDKIANLYAHSSKEMQHLMERSSLVLLDVDKAIENGFVKMTNELATLFDTSDVNEQE